MDSYRQAKRIRKRLKEEWLKGVIHGRSNKPSNHLTANDVEEKMLQLSQQPYGEGSRHPFCGKKGLIYSPCF